jgi:NAD-dependent deacetylase
VKINLFFVKLEGPFPGRKEPIAMCTLPKMKSDPNAIASAKRRIGASTFRVAITGAGISEASGLPLLCDRARYQEIQPLFDPQALADDPVEYYTLYRRVLEDWRSVSPNSAHHALVKAGFWVITLNIDGLHRDAGTEHLIEMHGNLRELRCRHCTSIHNSQVVWKQIPPRCPVCNDRLWPGISLRGDPIRHYSLATDWVGRAEVLFIVGTSLSDAPARNLPSIAKENGAFITTIGEDAEHWIPDLLVDLYAP